jgi:glycine oxidase
LTNRSADVVVVGAGIIGCSVARALAREGLEVLVLERSRIAAESSGAAAGILAPRVHATDAGMFDLALDSHRRFESLVAELREETGLDVEFARSSAWVLALDEADEERLRDKVRWLQGLGHEVAWVDRARVLAEEPAVAPGLRGAFFDADAYQISPPRFTNAMGQAAARAGVEFRYGLDVIGLRRSNGRATAVETTAGPIAADRVIVAAGAWSGRFGEWLGFDIPVFPAKGQILTVVATPPPLQGIIFGPDAYLLPRLDGTVVVGATVENVGFDKSMTASGLAWLLESLNALCPALANAPLDRFWTGLRPASPDDLPIVGRAPGWDNVLIATGHHRNGIMLAPTTARIVADLVLHGKTEISGATGLSPGRFPSA